MDQTYMKQKPVLPLVVSMALPMTLSMLVKQEKMLYCWVMVHEYM